jgi:hypothetical protein
MAKIVLKKSAKKIELVYAKNDHDIGFQEKRQFFRRAIGELSENFVEIAENCDHNIDPWSLSTSLYVCVPN